jgi:hypothetical protein
VGALVGALEDVLEDGTALGETEGASVGAGAGASVGSALLSAAAVSLFCTTTSLCTIIFSTVGAGSMIAWSLMYWVSMPFCAAAAFTKVAKLPSVHACIRSASSFPSSGEPAPTPAESIIIVIIDDEHP